MGRTEEGLSSEIGVVSPCFGEISGGTMLFRIRRLLQSRKFIHEKNLRKNLFLSTLAREERKFVENFKVRN